MIICVDRMLKYHLTILLIQFNWILLIKKKQIIRKNDML